MENLNKKGQCSLMYRVDINPNSRWYNQSKSGAMALTPIEFESRKSPLVARRKAFKFVNMKDRPIKAHDLNVFLFDMATGNEYLIYNGQEPSSEVLKNLYLECLLYDEAGYEFQNWTLLKDAEERKPTAIVNSEPEKV